MANIRFDRFNPAELEKWFTQFFSGSPIYVQLLFKTDGGLMADLTVKDDSGPLSAVANFLDAEGNATTPDDVPTWASSDESVATVVASEDGTDAVVTPTSRVGATMITLHTVDADGTELNGQMTLTVEPSEAATVDITLSPQAEAPATP
jgi:hypothetical protein